MKEIYLDNGVQKERYINDIIDCDYVPNEEAKISYEDLVDSKIRAKYSISEEFAILRQKEDKPVEYTEYYNYCEQCKQEAKVELGI